MAKAREQEDLFDDASALLQRTESFLSACAAGGPDPLDIDEIHELIESLRSVSRNADVDDSAATEPDTRKSA